MKSLAVLLSALFFTGNLSAGMLSGTGGKATLPGGSGSGSLPRSSASASVSSSGGRGSLPSPPPVSGGGDAFASATLLSGFPVSDVGNNATSTKEAGEPNHSGYSGDTGGKSRWWKWTSTVDGLLVVSTEGSDFDTTVGVYTGGEVASLDTQGNDDNSGAGQTSKLTVRVFPGTAYYIAVDGYNGTSGNIKLRLSVTPTPTSSDGRPINDNFANRKVLIGTNTTDFGTNSNATLEADDPQPFISGGDIVIGQNVWWSWTAPSDGTATFLTDGSSYDTTMVVYSGSSLNSLLSLGFNDDGGESNASKLTLSVQAGVTYQIAVDGFLSTGLSGSRTTGDITLNVSLAPRVGRQKNDAFDFRTGIQGNSYAVESSVQGSGVQTGEPNHGANSDTRSVWWTWNSPAADVGTATIKATRNDASALNPVIAVYKGSDLSSLVPVTFALDANDDGATALAFVTEPGVVYQIAVAGTVANNTNQIDDDGSFDFEFGYVSGKPAFVTPLAGQSVVAGSSVTFTVVKTATTLNPVSYQWQRKIGNVWSNFLDGGVYSGAITESLTISPTSLALNGQVFRCVMTNASGSVTSAEATLRIVPVPPKAVAGPVSIRPGAGVPPPLNDVNHKTSDNGYPSAKYYAQGLPSGLTINATTGVISGTLKAAPGNYTVTYWTQSGTVKSAIQTVVISVTGFPSSQTGNYEALILDNQDASTGLPLGKLEVTINSTGAFTGKFTSAAAAVNTFKGNMVRSLDDLEASASVAIVRKGFAKAQIDFAVTASGITATLKAGATTLGTAVSGVKVTTTNVQWNRTYTMVLGDLDDFAVTPSKPLPEGVGYASVKVVATGIMTITGRNADGTPLTATLASAGDATYRLYAKPSANVGSYVGGWLKLTVIPTQTLNYEGTVLNNSDLYWQVAASSKNATYPAGFGPVGLSARIDSWNNLRVPADLNLDANTGFFDVKIDGGGITNVLTNVNQLPKRLRVLNGGQISLTDQNYRSWSISVSPSTGVFTGSFTLSQPVSRKVTFAGILSQLPPVDAATVPLGRGYFLLPSTVKNGPVVSGSIQFVTP